MSERGAVLLLLLVALTFGASSQTSAATRVVSTGSAEHGVHFSDREIPKASAHLQQEIYANQNAADIASGSERGEGLVARWQEESVRQFKADAAALHAHRSGRKKPARRLQVATPHTIRITVEYQTQTQLQLLQQKQVQQVMDTAVRVIQKFLQVRSPLQNPLQVRRNAILACSPADVSTSLVAGWGPGSPGTDYYLIVTAQSGAACLSGAASDEAGLGASLNTSAVAWAMACDYSLDTASFGRPILGVINLCPGAVDAATAAASAAIGGLISDGIVDVFVHELLHSLGFSSSMFSTWLDWNSANPPGNYPSGGVTSVAGVPYLSTPIATAAAQTILNCTQLSGAPLEDEGSPQSASSHWEFRYFNQEIMSPFYFTTKQRQRLSMLSLAAMQDTGWYFPRMQYAQQLDIQQLPPGTMSCDLALLDCLIFQGQYPDAYYCGPNSSPDPMAALTSQLPTLQCFTPTVPAACDSTRYSNGCSVLHPSSLPCSQPNVASLLPNTTNYFTSNMPSSPVAQGDFYKGFGAAFGPGSTCLSWYNSSSTAQPYAGCFYSQCDARGVPQVAAVLPTMPGVLIQVPCPPGTTVMLSSYLPVRDQSTALVCPTLAQAAEICSPPPPDTCPGGRTCVNGACGTDGSCICDLEFMGANCSIHVSVVSDFDNPTQWSPGNSNSPGNSSNSPGGSLGEGTNSSIPQIYPSPVFASTSPGSSNGSSRSPSGGNASSPGSNSPPFSSNTSVLGNNNTSNSTGNNGTASKESPSPPSPQPTPGNSSPKPPTPISSGVTVGPPTNNTGISPLSLLPSPVQPTPDPPPSHDPPSIPLTPAPRHLPPPPLEPPPLPASPEPPSSSTPSPVDPPSIPLPPPRPILSPSHPTPPDASTSPSTPPEEDQPRSPSPSPNPPPSPGPESSPVPTAAPNPSPGKSTAASPSPSPSPESDQPPSPDGNLSPSMSPSPRPYSVDSPSPEPPPSTNPNTFPSPNPPPSQSPNSVSSPSPKPLTSPSTDRGPSPSPNPSPSPPRQMSPSPNPPGHTAPSPGPPAPSQGPPGLVQPSPNPVSWPSPSGSPAYVAALEAPMYPPMYPHRTAASQADSLVGGSTGTESLAENVLEALGASVQVIEMEYGQYSPPKGTATAADHPSSRDSQSHSPSTLESKPVQSTAKRRHGTGIAAFRRLMSR